MKGVKPVNIVVVVAVVIVIASPAPCGDDVEAEKGLGVCRPDGAWLGISPVWGLDWTAVYTSVSHRWGTLSLRFVGGDPSFYGSFPATSLSRTTGTWVRTGRRTFEYTMIHYGLAADGQTPVFIGKMIGSAELSIDCDRMELINWSMSVYHPTHDPFGLHLPILRIQDGGHSTARRIPVQPPP